MRDASAPAPAHQRQRTPTPPMPIATPSQLSCPARHRHRSSFSRVRYASAPAHQRQRTPTPPMYTMPIATTSQLSCPARHRILYHRHRSTRVLAMIGLNESEVGDELGRMTGTFSYADTQKQTHPEPELQPEPMSSLVERMYTLV